MVDLDKEIRKTTICHDEETHYQEYQKKGKLINWKNKVKLSRKRASHKIIYERKWIIQWAKRKQKKKILQ